jgi:hypothetical protein
MWYIILALYSISLVLGHGHFHHMTITKFRVNVFDVSPSTRLTPAEIWYNSTVALRKIGPDYVKYLSHWYPQDNEPKYWTGAIIPEESTTPQQAINSKITVPDHQPIKEHSHKNFAQHCPSEMKKILKHSDVYAFCLDPSKLPVSPYNYRAFVTVSFDKVPFNTGYNWFAVKVAHFHSHVKSNTLDTELIMNDWGTVTGVNGWQVNDDLSHMSGLLIVPKGSNPTVKISIQSDSNGFSPVIVPMIYPSPKTHCDYYNERINAIPGMFQAKKFSIIMFIFMSITVFLSIALTVRFFIIHRRKRNMMRNSNASGGSSAVPSQQVTNPITNTNTTTSSQSLPPGGILVYTLGSQPNGQQMVAVPISAIQALYSQNKQPTTTLPIPPPSMNTINNNNQATSSNNNNSPPPSYIIASNLPHPLPSTGITLPLNFPIN